MNGERASVIVGRGVFVNRGVLSWIILFVLKLVMGDLRVSEEAEHEGLDLSEHQETAYGQPS